MAGRAGAGLESADPGGVLGSADTGGVIVRAKSIEQHERKALRAFRIG